MHPSREVFIIFLCVSRSEDWDWNLWNQIVNALFTWRGWDFCRRGLQDLEYKRMDDVRKSVFEESSGHVQSRACISENPTLLSCTIVSHPQTRDWLCLRSICPLNQKNCLNTSETLKKYYYLCLLYCLLYILLSIYTYIYFSV